jgi:hypothetical protein
VLADSPHGLKQWRPWYLIFRFPVVFWAGFQYGAALVNYNILNGTLSPILTAAPYNFSNAVTGCMCKWNHFSGKAIEVAADWAPLIGVIIGGMIAGQGGDKYAIWAARRNNGVREPEQRLMILVLAMIFVRARQLGSWTWLDACCRSPLA